MKVEQIAAEAKQAAQTLSFAATEQKNNALSKAAQALTQNTAAIWPPTKRIWKTAVPPG